MAHRDIFSKYRDTAIRIRIAVVGAHLDHGSTDVRRLFGASPLPTPHTLVGNP